MLLEDEPQAMKRMNASKAIPMERFRSAKEAFSVADTTGVAFAEALMATSTGACGSRRTMGTAATRASRCGTSSPSSGAAAPRSR